MTQGGPPPRASRNDAGNDAGDDAYQIVDKTVCYDGHFRLERHRVRFRLFAGGWSEVVEREVFERGHAAAVLLYDARLDRVVLVEQFRAPAVDAPGGPWLLETVAGIIEAGETAEAVVHREAMEEAGCAVGELVRIGEVLPSPGGCTERLTLYCGRVDAAAAGGIHGLAEDGEDIRVVTMSADEAMAAVADGRIRAANAVIPLQWLALNRERLRAAWGGPG
ncbi:MAG: NUDIX domain-containing protein [Proteobacteria bacterium]|nr:NUDIX domain-containing protein [Pseudomonadota bacterium]